MSFLRLMWEFFRRDAKIALSYRFQMFFQAAGMLSVCVTFFFVSLMLGRVQNAIPTLDKYGGSYFAFVIIGLAISTYVDSSLRTFSSSVRTAQVTGTFEAMLTTRTPIGAVVAGSALYTLVFTMARGSLLLIFGVTIFGMNLHHEGWPVVVVVLALTVACTMALGIFAAGFIVLFKQGDPLSQAISGMSWLLSGVLYPKEILPGWVQNIAALLPVTHAMEAARLALLQGVPIDQLWGSIFGLMVFAGVGLPGALIWFAWAVHRARVAGSLAKY